MPANETAVELRAYVATEVDGTPDLEEHNPLWQVLKVRHAIGGVWEAEIAFDIGAENGGRLENQSLTDHKNYKVEIFAYGANGVRIKGLFWGEIVGRNASISSHEQDVYTARLRRHHFGLMPRGAEVWKSDVVLDEDDTDGSGAIIETDHDFYFNPVIDGKVHYNRDTSHANGDPEGPDPDFEQLQKYFLLIDPEQGLSARALQSQGIVADEWYLPHVLAYFLWSLNFDEEYVKNPEHPSGDTADDVVADLEEALIDPPEIVNINFPRSQYLPFYLSSLLDSHGYGWSVDAEYDTGEEFSHIKPRIRVFTRGHVSDGDTEKKLPLDAIGEFVDKSKCLEIRLQSDMTNMPIALVGTGDYKQYEMTLPLYRAWPVDQDGTLGEANDVVNRMWVANEGWDYSGLRPDINSPNLGLEFTIRRRKAEDCLTTYRDEQTGKRVRRAPYLQYSTGGAWADVPEEWGFRVLPDQIGVKFHRIPEELLVDDISLRLTCTVSSDSRITNTVNTFSNQHVDIQFPNLAHYDLSQRFKFRERKAAGAFSSALVNKGEADEIDDEEKMEDYLERLVKFEQQMPTEMQVQLFGLNFDYRIGDVITEIEGRNINTEVTATVPEGDERYPQVVGITWMPGTQTTILDISTTATPEVV